MSISEYLMPLSSTGTSLWGDTDINLKEGLLCKEVVMTVAFTMNHYRRRFTHTAYIHGMLL